MKRQCTRCLFDTTVQNISFDSEGICNYCQMHDALDKEYPLGTEGKKRLDAIVEQIRQKGHCKDYDCIVGVSGGCDSSYLLYWTKKVLGLRPLAVHFDNSWNSKVALENIQNVVKSLSVDLYSYAVDREEYDDICLAFLKSGVKDIDAPTDIGLATVLYMAAEKYGIGYIFEGHSFRTEGVQPIGWAYVDGKYIESVQKQYGTRSFATYPNLWLSSFVRWAVTTVSKEYDLCTMWTIKRKKPCVS